MKDAIKKILVGAESKIHEILPEIKLLTVIEEDPEQCIPELGISGSYTKSDRTIQIWFDSNCKFLKENLEEQVTRSFAHEYMHAFREEKIPWEGCTLLEALIAEGLTQHFETEVWHGGKPAPYSTHLTPKELDHVWNRAQTELSSSDFDYNAWFFGSENADLKRWTGYSLGYWLVGNHLNTSGLPSSKLGQTPAQEFLSKQLA